ncbi:MAG: riboflavin synthase [Deltaproteobacteria bacterium]|nr:riboflavin synthase [Deltaproteobacteria bacterium]
MFTGIIETIGTVKSVEKKGGSAKIAIISPFKGGGLKAGDSIAVDGACLTVTGFKGEQFTADVSEETIRKTTLGSLKTGDRVNLERPLTPLKPLGGHIVTGHIDCVGELKDKSSSGDYATLGFAIPAEFQRLVVYKGSVAVDGISLTVAKITESGFTVALIPHTLETTTISDKKTGSKVNIETDIIGKYVERFLSAYKKGGITEGFLEEHGFLKGGE